MPRAAKRLPLTYATPCLLRQTPYAGTSHTARFLTWQTGLSHRHPSVLPPPAQAHAPARAHGHRGKPPSAAPCAPHHIRTQGRTAERLPPAYAIPCLPRQTPYAGTAPIQRAFLRRQQACRQGFPTAAGAQTRRLRRGRRALGPSAVPACRAPRPPARGRAAGLPRAQCGNAHMRQPLRPVATAQLSLPGQPAPGAA